MKKTLIKRILSAIISFTMIVVLCACTSEKANTPALPIGEVPEYQNNLDLISPLAYNNVDGLNLKAGTYISIIGRSSSSAFSTALAKGAEQAASDLNKVLGFTGEDKIKVTINSPSIPNDIDDQVNILDEELSRYPDAIGIASIDAEACTVQFDLATENGIPIVAFDSGNDYNGILCTCETDNTKAAATAAENLSAQIGDTGEIILIAHDSSSTTATSRVSGFIDELTRNHPNVKVVETIHADNLNQLKKNIAAEKNAALTEDEAQISSNSLSDNDVIQYYMEKHPQVKALFGTNDITTQLAVSTCKQMKNADSVMIMGFDSSEEQLSALRDGQIAGLSIQNPFGMGYATVVACARTILGQTNEAVVHTGHFWIDANNMDEESISKMLYK